MGNRHRRPGGSFSIGGLWARKLAVAQECQKAKGHSISSYLPIIEIDEI
jgi:hypothetical protein